MKSCLTVVSQYIDIYRETNTFKPKKHNSKTVRYVHLQIRGQSKSASHGMDIPLMHPILLSVQRSRIANDAVSPQRATASEMETKCLTNVNQMTAIFEYANINITYMIYDI